MFDALMFVVCFTLVVALMSDLVILGIYFRQEKIMSTGTSNAQALADLQGAVSALQAQVLTLTSASQGLDAAIALLEAELASNASAGPAISPTAIETVVSQLKSVQTSIGSVVTDVQAQTTGASAAGGPVIKTTSLPDGTVGTVYSQLLLVSGGTAPYTGSISAGSLPAGLTLDPATGAIAGTPTAAGSSAFTVQVADSKGLTTSAKLTINIAAAAPARSTKTQ